jgi:hypothetical protein
MLSSSGRPTFLPRGEQGVKVFHKSRSYCHGLPELDFVKQNKTRKGVVNEAAEKL